ncbi:PREDICTED: protein FAM162B-like [Gavialis gangeticus]|uniref:protein FAM162B-like n=1 Tax=Gavialis gangeticus TaxID=94835 RepID=UPI00092E6CCF|nr:PREDICTED: protein FAM162B-like [Gavialis gangeticus]
MQRCVSWQSRGRDLTSHRDSGNPRVVRACGHEIRCADVKQHGCVNTLGGSHTFPAGTLGPRCLVAEAGQRQARGRYSTVRAMLGRALGSKALVAGLRRMSVARGSLCIKEAPRAPQARRAFCDISKDGKGAPLQTAAPGRSALRNERQPTGFEKKALIWAGRFEKEEDIPELVSSEAIKAAKNTVRIRASYVMMALTLLCCLAMAISGKHASKKDNTLVRMNQEKKARWKEEGERDREVAVVKAE